MSYVYNYDLHSLIFEFFKVFYRKICSSNSTNRNLFPNSLIIMPVGTKKTHVLHRNYAKSSLYDNERLDKDKK